MPAVNPGTTNLSAWWPLDGDGIDAHSGGHDLTTVGAVTYTTGIVGSAATSFSGTKYLTAADHADLSVGALDYTVAAWFYPLSAHTGIIVAKDGTAGGTREFALDIDSGKLLLVGYDAISNPAFVYSGNTYNLNAWNFGVARYNATTRVWTVRLNGGADVNGAAIASATVNGVAAVSIGARASGAQPFNGRIDIPTIWRRRLTDDEVEWLYNAGAGRAYSELSAAKGLPVIAHHYRQIFGG